MAIIHKGGLSFSVVKIEAWQIRLDGAADVDRALAAAFGTGFKARV